MLKIKDNVDLKEKVKKKISYFFVVDEDGDQMSIPTPSYKEAKKDLKEIIKNSSGFHRYAIDEIEMEER